MSVIENKKIVNKFVSSVLNQQNVDVLNELVATTFSGHLPGGELSGRDALVTHLQNAYSATPELRVTVDDEIADEDKVVHRLGLGEAGEALLIYRIQGGQIIEMWEAIRTTAPA